jgi:hypothetical protein
MDELRRMHFKSKHLRTLGIRWRILVVHLTMLSQHFSIGSCRLTGLVVSNGLIVLLMLSSAFQWESYPELHLRIELGHRSKHTPSRL